MTPLVVGVTSHRNIAAHDVELIRQRVRDFFLQLQHQFPELPIVVLSALAEGGDQLVAQEALAAGAQLIAPIPLPRALYEDDFVHAQSRLDFAALFSRAEIVELPTRADTRHEDLSKPGIARDRQYAKAGVYIASHCHILLAIWDGKETGRLGGTAQIVKYHLTGTLPGLIDRRRDTRHILGGGDERLLFHIVCSRDGGDGETTQSARPLRAIWRTMDSSHDGGQMPDEFALMFTRMAEFNAECSTYAQSIQDSASADFPDASAGRIHRMFHATDWLAIHFQKRVLLAMRLTYTLAALMGIAFTLYAHMAAQNELIYLFLLLFASGGFVAVLANRRGWHRKYLDYRALAEGLRIQSYWRRAGITASADHEFSHDNFLQKQNIELGWIRNVMRAASMHQTNSSTACTPEALAEVIAEWVGESGISGQLHYYERKTAERSGVHHVTETIGSISLWGGISISVFLAVFVRLLSEDRKNALVMIMAVLSIIAAVREAYAYRKADKELIRQYRFMQRIFASARSALDATHDPVHQREILFALGDAALTEHAEWTLMQRERQVEHSKL